MDILIKLSFKYNVRECKESIHGLNPHDFVDMVSSYFSYAKFLERLALKYIERKLILDYY